MTINIMLWCPQFISFQQLLYSGSHLYPKSAHGGEPLWKVSCFWGIVTSFQNPVEGSPQVLENQGEEGQGQDGKGRTEGGTRMLCLSPAQALAGNLHKRESAFSAMTTQYKGTSSLRQRKSGSTVPPALQVNQREK